MQNRLHFISGLPRSGSTLLAALLRQNPRISAGMSSPSMRSSARCSPKPAPATKARCSSTTTSASGC
ncbi:MAG: sulfotransferase [Roseiarcus sp.]|uniref:sulfotransferase n=1 Tax=Roseiarcus sp. TaxID=1969460 RepID=UPI003C44787B